MRLFSISCWSKSVLMYWAPRVFNSVSFYADGVEVPIINISATLDSGASAV